MARQGVDRPLLDNGAIAPAIREITPAGVDAVLELVGTNTLRDSLQATRVHGTVCFTGMVSNEWTIRDSYPIEYIPTGVRLTAYGGEAADLPREVVLQRYLDDVGTDRLPFPIHRVFEMDEIVEAHRTMESNAAMGEMVVRVKQWHSAGSKTVAGRQGHLSNCRARVGPSTLRRNREVDNEQHCEWT